MCPAARRVLNQSFCNYARVFKHGLKICNFLDDIQVKFYYFFVHFELSNFIEKCTDSRHLVCIIPSRVLYQAF